MTYNTENLRNNQPGKTAESGSQSYEAGLYRHPEAIDKETGKLAEMITLYDPLFGNAQSEAAVRLGFVRISDAPEGSIKNIIEVQKDAKQFNTDTVMSDKARLDALELESLRAKVKSFEESKVEVKEEIVEDEEVTSQSTEVDSDTYTAKTTKSGIVQYRKNGNLISKEEYDNK